MKNLTCLPLLFLLVFLFSNCKNEPAPTTETGDQLGQLQLKVTCSEAALPHFEKGLKLLHNFEYEDAATAFIQAQDADSTCALSYWGEAMTYNHPLWRQQDFEKGQAALAKLAGTPEARAAAAATDLERGLLQGMEIMYGPGGTKKERDSLYSKHLENLHKKYPDNHEVAAFYALSILGAVPVGRDVAAYERGAKVVQGIIAENPQHPGALHYLIHSFDDPQHAPQALPAARAYSVVAADAPHALHMPSHIFVSVGMWEEVVKSNIASWKASTRWVADRGIDDQAGSYHALHWWAYGLQQQGRFAEAEKLLTEMEGYAEKMPTERARGYLVSMKANYLAETGDWTDSHCSLSADLGDLNISTRALAHFAEGMKKHAEGDAMGLGKTLAKMKADRKDAAKLVSETGLPMCASAGANRNTPNRADLDEARVFELQLQALQASLIGTPGQEEEFLKQATELESAISYSFGPPHIAVPTYEQYGHWLLAHDRPAEAATQFEKALEKGPKRKLALEGRLAAAKQLGDEEKAAEIEEVLGEILQGEI